MSIKSDSGYRDWLAQLKDKFRNVQMNAAIAVNSEMLQFYWELGAEIVEKQKTSSWGDRLLPHLSRDLSAEFPEMKGFSVSNLKYMRQWFLFYTVGTSIGQQAVGQIAQPSVSQITRIPWGHNLAIIAKCKNLDEALYYVQNTIFSQTLPANQSDLLRQTFKDPYILDFMMLTKEHNERELEQGLIQHITQFLLELGTGFAYIGRQVPLQVGGRSTIFIMSPTPYTFYADIVIIILWLKKLKQRLHYGEIKEKRDISPYIPCHPSDALCCPPCISPCPRPPHGGI